MPAIGDVPPGGTGSEALRPQRAPVTPRARETAGGAALPIERRVRALLDSGRRGLVNVYGPPGAGKSTALRHLAAVLPIDAPVILIDSNVAIDPLAPPVDRILIFTTSDRVRDADNLLAAWELAPWGDDEFLEYTVATHRDRCASVLSRARAAAADDLPPVPELWAPLLELLATDDALSDARAALARVIDRTIDPRTRGAIADECLAFDSSATDREAMRHLESRVPLDPEPRRLLRHFPVRMLLAAEALVERVAEGCGLDVLSPLLPPAVIAEAGRRAAGRPALLASLDRILRDRKHPARHPAAAGIRFAADPAWRPDGIKGLNLAGAILPRAAWADLRLDRLQIAGAEARGAVCARAVLGLLVADRANLAGANFRDAIVNRLTCRDARLPAADLCGLIAGDAHFEGADLRHADLRGARLHDSRFAQSDLTAANLACARLTESYLIDCPVGGADFSGADATKSQLTRLDLRAATLTGLVAERAGFTDCDLQAVTMPRAAMTGAQFSRCDFTGSVLPAAAFAGARFAGCGLADVQWEGADLRDADFTGSTFHMGSTRSGLVGSTIPCEGSKTGFYTDDYDDRDHTPPEEIRKANLCRADLRGAHIESTDFYLVDLRGAKYTPAQEAHLRRCRAILGRADEYGPRG